MTDDTKRASQLTQGEKRAIMLEVLRKEGYSDYEASQIMGVSRQRVSKIGQGMANGTIAPLVKKARKSLKLLLEGKAVGDMTEVKGSDVLGAIKIVADRAEPVIQKIESRSASINIDLSAEERERFTKMLGLDRPTLPEAPKQLEDKPVEATFEPVQESSEFEIAELTKKVNSDR